MSDLKPDKKVGVSGVAGAVTTIIVWIFSVVPPHIEIPGVVAASITTVIMFISGYVIKEQSRE